MPIHSLTLLVASVISLVSPQAFASSPLPRDSSVTVPIDDYLELRKRSELPSLTTIEEVTLTGTFGKTLGITFSGSSSGTPTLKDILLESANLGLHDCKGEAIFHLHEGKVAILATAKRFKLSCEVSVRSWGSIELKLLDSSFFRSFVTGAEAISDFGGDSKQTIALSPLKKDVGAPVKVEITSVARYQLTVLPEETRFQYWFQLNNPGRGKRRYEIKLPNKELIQKVKTQAEYDLSDDGRLAVNLVPGENMVDITGTLAVASAGSFQLPLRSGQQYALIENHPMLTLAVTSKARLISARDAGINPSFPSARAYLLGDADTLGWTAKKLDVFRSLGFSVTQASYLYYVPEDALPIVEAQLDVDNQGTPEIPLGLPGTATYLEVDGEPQVLSKDSDGKLLLRLPSGRHRALIQYQGQKQASGVLSLVRDELAKPASIVSNVNLTLGLAPKWRLLAATIMLQSESDFDGRMCLAALLAGLIAFLAFRASTLARPRKLALALLVGGAVFLQPWCFSWVLLTGMAVTVIRLRSQLQAYFLAGWKNRIAFVGSLLACLLAYTFVTAYFAGIGGGGGSRQDGMGMFSSKLAQKAMNSMAEDASSEGSYGGAIGSAPAPLSAPRGAVARPKSEATPQEPSAGADYQGLPARVQLPGDMRRFSFSQGLLDEHGEVRLRSLVISRGVLGGLGLLFLVLLGLSVYRDRRPLRAFLKV